MRAGRTACHLVACPATTYTSTSLHLQHSSRPPILHSSTPPRARPRSMPPKLLISISLHIHVPTPAAHSQSSRAHTCTGWTVQVKLMIWTENGEVVGGKGALVCGGSGGSLSV